MLCIKSVKSVKSVKLSLRRRHAEGVCMDRKEKKAKAINAPCNLILVLIAYNL
jgi:hypothetical protein